MQTQSRQPQARLYTADEYLAIEETAENRSEYRNGEIIPMTGGSIEHNRILGNFFALLKAFLRGKEFEPFLSDLRLWIPQYRIYTYPNMMVIQGEPVFQEQRTDTITNPRLIKKREQTRLPIRAWLKCSRNLPKTTIAPPNFVTIAPFPASKNMC